MIHILQIGTRWFWIRAGLSPAETWEISRPFVSEYECNFEACHRAKIIHPCGPAPKEREVERG